MIPRARDSMVMVESIQDLRREWARENFGEQTPAQMMMGICEEVGELAHHQLKMEQGIRGSQDEHMAGIRDAIGDIVMYLMGYCDTHNLELTECIADAWHEIRDRDWKQNPVDGKPREEFIGFKKVAEEIEEADRKGRDNFLRQAYGGYGTESAGRLRDDGALSSEKQLKEDPPMNEAIQHNPHHSTKAIANLRERIQKEARPIRDAPQA